MIHLGEISLSGGRLDELIFVMVVCFMRVFAGYYFLALCCKMKIMRKNVECGLPQGEDEGTTPTRG